MNTDYTQPMSSLQDEIEQLLALAASNYPRIAWIFDTDHARDLLIDRRYTNQYGEPICRLAVRPSHLILACCGNDTSKLCVSLGSYEGNEKALVLVFARQWLFDKSCIRGQMIRVASKYLPISKEIAAKCLLLRDGDAV